MKFIIVCIFIINLDNLQKIILHLNIFQVKVILKRKKKFINFLTILKEYFLGTPRKLKIQLKIKVMSEKVVISITINVVTRSLQLNSISQFYNWY